MIKTEHGAKPFILFALFALYLSVLFRLTVFRGAGAGMQSVNLIPFSTVSEYFQYVLHGNRFIGIINLLGNLIILFPLGYLSAMLFPKTRRLTRAIALSFFLSVAIEGLQYILSCGAADIDDVILNTAGGVWGYLTYAMRQGLLRQGQRQRKYAACLPAGQELPIRKG